MTTPTEAARRFGVHPNTIRQWARDYSDFLSQSGAPMKGQDRKFTEADLVTLHTIAVLKAEGKRGSDLVDELATGTRIEPLDATETAQEATEDTKTKAGPKTPTEAAKMALELVQGQVDNLTNERDWLRSRLDVEIAARIDAEKRAAAAEAKLEEKSKGLFARIFGR